MGLRSLLRVILASAIAYGLFFTAPEYISEQCALPSLRHTSPCVAYTAASDKVDHYANQVWHIVKNHKYTNALEQQYYRSGVHPHLTKAYSTANHHWTNKIHPFVSHHSSRASKLALLHSKRAGRQSATFLQVKAWPFVKASSLKAKRSAVRQAKLLWKKIESSHMWEDVVVKQTMKIYDTVVARAKQAREDISEATEFVAERKEEILQKEKEKAQSAAHSSESVAAALAASASASSEIAASASASASASLASAASAAAASGAASGAASSESASEPASDSAATKSWTERVERNVDYAIANLEEDVDAALESSINSAKPEIMGILRNIAKYGEEAVKNTTELANKIEQETDQEIEAQIKREVYDAYDVHLKHMADLAFKVRDRVEQLAQDSLTVLDPVRTITLDALDDYMEVALNEAARELTAKDDWNGWKEYHKLKQQMKTFRERVETYEFNMDKVNSALRESQAASVLLVQQYNQKLTDLRAKVQFVIQDRAAERKSEDEFWAKEAAEEVEAAEKAKDTEESKEPEAEAEAEAETQVTAEAETETETETETAIPVETPEPIESENPEAVVDVEVPFEEEIQFEDNDETQTVWETRKVIQTV